MIRKADVERLLKAVKQAGFCRGRLIVHLDGRLEIVGDDGQDIASVPIPENTEPPNPWDELKR